MMKKLLVGFLVVLFAAAGAEPTFAYYIPYNPFPAIGSTEYLGDIDFFDIGEPISIYIADDDTIDTMIYTRFYTKDNRRWSVKILFVPKSEKVRQVFVDEVNEGANNGTWMMNNRLAFPVNNKFWALREDISYSPKEQTIKVNGCRAYNYYGEMLGFDQARVQKTVTFKYGEDKSYSAVCDLVSIFMAERYQDAIMNSQDFVR